MRPLPLIATLLAVANALYGGAQAEERNLIANGGFEKGLAGWKADPKQTLVADAGAAHSGKACLSGEVAEPQKWLKLSATVPVRIGNLYPFRIWARATNRTKLVLWAVQPGSTSRTMIATWKNVPAAWTRYEVPITPGGNGDLSLEIIAPSSMQAPPGRIWIDDIALFETAVPAPLIVSDPSGFADAPSMARAADGSLYLSWLSFRDGADTLQVARFGTGEHAVEKLGQWQVLGGRNAYVLGPKVVEAGDRALVVYAAEENGDWDIFAVPCSPEGPEQPIALTRDKGVDIKPAAAWRDGSLWLAWESNRNGCRQVFAASVRGGKVSLAEAVSPDDVSSYSPTLAILESGEVCVAWHSFRESNYDVFLRRRSPEGTWGQERRLTRAPSIDRNALLVAHGGELWLVYENAQTSTYHIGTTNHRRLIAARVEPDGLKAPKDYRHSLLYGRCEGPSACFDASGRLWLACLRPRLPRAGWDAFLTCLNGSRWLPPSPLSASKGMDRPPALVVDGGRAFVAFQVGDLPPTWRHVPKPAETHSQILLTSLDLTAPPAVPMDLGPLDEPDEPFEAGTLRLARGEDAPTPSIQYGGKTLKLFYGDLHEHTEVSVCNRVGDQSIDESYQHMRDIARYDFACITDHGYNQTPYLWATAAKLARANGDPDRFLTFLGQEWTSSFEKYDDKHPYGYYGHRNLILADLHFPRWWNANNGQTPAELWAELKEMKANFVHIPHQLADTGNVPTDWTFHDEAIQPVAEIFQARGSYEYPDAPRAAKRSTPKRGCYLQDAWASGIVIGVIASPDHGGGYGKAAVYAPELTREAVLDAIRARHTYGTTAAKISLDFRVNGRLMGEKTAATDGKPVVCTIRVVCPAEIDRIEVCRSNEFIFRNEPGARSAEVTFVDEKPLAGRSYYYVRVIQKDGEIAWSSPVWLNAP